VSGISCHVLDTAIGRPAAGVGVRLERLDSASSSGSSVSGASASWRELSRATTNADGRASGLEGQAGVQLGLHGISFETEAYLRGAGQPVFYPEVQVLFVVGSSAERYHVPLLLSPFGYSTYRGS